MPISACRWCRMCFRTAARWAASTPACGRRRVNRPSPSPATCRSSCRRGGAPRHRHARAEADVVAPLIGEQSETLHAAYGKACLGPMEAPHPGGTAEDHRVLPRRARARRLPEAAIARVRPIPALVFMNVNTPAELERARWALAPAAFSRFYHGSSRPAGSGSRRSRRSTCCRARWRKRSTSASCRASCSAASRSAPTPCAGRTDARLVRITAPEERPWARIEVRSSPARPGTRPSSAWTWGSWVPTVPELAFVQINDPAAPQLRVDRDADGRDTLFGTASRNHAEEKRGPMRERARPRAGAPRDASAGTRARSAWRASAG